MWKIKKNYSLFFIFLFCSLFSQNLNDPQNLQMEVVFQDYFKNDTITLKINNTTIVNKAIISSNDIGFSKLQYNFTENSIVSKYDKQKQYIPLVKNVKIKKVVHINILCNGFSKKFRINLQKGKHIGFDLICGKLKINQSEKKFIYD